MELTDITLKEASRKLASKGISARELVAAFLNRVKQVDKSVHAFLSVYENEALACADEADGRILDGTSFSLTGIPYAVKDCILVKGAKATAGSKILENYIAPYDATVIKKLKDQTPVMIGKTNMDEFAMGSSTENSAFGPTKNPYDLDRVPGGSSGGSAAAVAAGEAIFALGSDTGGSVRQPAAFCGVVGLKPTYGRVSRHGLMAMGSSLDQIGVFSKTVEDCAIVFGQIAGTDERDSTSLPQPVPDYVNLLKEDLKGIKVGMPKEYFGDGMDKEVRKVIEDSIKVFERLGAIIEEVSLPHSKYALSVYYVIMPVEVSANLSRYDGIRYGLSLPGQTLEEVYYNTRSEGLGSETKRRIMIGAYASSAGYYDAYYKKAIQVRRLIRQDFVEAFKKVDIMVTPTSPNRPWKFGEKSKDPLLMYLEDIFTVGLNVAGVPGISVPSGVLEDGLPVGLQIIAPHFAEERLFASGHAFEKALDLKIKPKL